MSHVDRCRALVLAAALLAVCAGGHGQDGAGRTTRVTGAAPVGWSRQFTPEFLRRDMRLFDEGLALDTAQRGIVEQLLRDYEDAFAAATAEVGAAFEGLDAGGESTERQARLAALREEMRGVVALLQSQRADPDANAKAIERTEQTLAALRDRIDALRPGTLDAADRRKLQERIEDIAGGWLDRRRGLRADLIEGLRAVLSAEQLERWPAFDRRLRRQKRLPMGRLSGESVDLTILLREVDASLADDARAVVEEYERALDDALVARDLHLERARIQTVVAMMNRDVDLAMAVASEEAQRREAVRAVNDRYAALIPAALAPAEAAAFRSAFRQRAYPTIYRPTTTQRAMRTALELPSLDDDQREIVVALAELHRRDLEPLNTALVRATQRREASGMLRRIRRWSGDQSDPERHLVAAADAERAKLDARYRDQLEAVLTAEQARRLPAETVAGARSPFDLDGDGTLSEAERDAARRSFRPQRSGGGGGGP